MGKAYFITATGTDSGKTFVAEGLARALVERGRVVRVLKPVLSGYDPASATESDAGRLLAACGKPVTPETIAAIAPWRFAAPLSPDRAATLEGRAIDFAALVEWCRAEIARREDVLLIEGVGGVMVPLDDRHTVRDWIAALGIECVLVAGSYLGALSHTLSALAALREVGICPTVVVVNESAVGVELDDFMASLIRHADGLAVEVVRRDEKRPHAVVEHLIY